jgi:hypothetical protein
MSADADAADDNEHNNDNATIKRTNNHVDVCNVDIINDGNNDSDDFRSDR